ncbi:MAG: 50S ribosomal protein L18 [Bradymonadia bacterium]
MATTSKKTISRARRKRSIRGKIFGTAERPRLSVFRSNKHIYAQIIDDVAGKTLAATSTATEGVRGDIAEKKKTEAAQLVGLKLAEKCKELSISSVVFDRNGFIYHGRVKAVAEGAREGGLVF